MKRNLKDTSIKTYFCWLLVMIGYSMIGYAFYNMEYITILSILISITLTGSIYIIYLISYTKDDDLKYKVLSSFLVAVGVYLVYIFSIYLKSGDIVDFLIDTNPNYSFFVLIALLIPSFLVGGALGSDLVRKVDFYISAFVSLFHRDNPKR